MLIAIRKRSWEEHVTHPSGLKYSYDDLDLVCCHGVDSDGVWIGSGALKQGRRTRCTSMPEGCPLSKEDVGLVPFEAASLVDDVIESEHMMLTKNNGKLSLDLQDSSYGPEPQHLPTISVVLCCQPNSRISSDNISCTTDPYNQVEKTLHYENDIDSVFSQSPICDDEVAFKSPQISDEEQQYISISSNKEPSLCESAGEQPGDIPNYQETKESHTESYSRSPRISEAALNYSSAAEVEPQTDCSDVAKGFIFTLGQAGSKAPVSVQQDLANEMESNHAKPLSGIPMEPLVTALLDGESCKELPACVGTTGQRFACILDEHNDLETLTGTAGYNHCSINVQGGQDYCAVVLDQGNDCEIFSQTLLEQCNVKMLAGNRPHGEESAQGESRDRETCVGQGPVNTLDPGVKKHCSSLTSNQTESTKQLSAGHSEDHSQTNTVQCADHQKKTCLSKPTENIEQLKALTVCEDPPICNPTENNCSKLETIPENSIVEPEDNTLLKSLKCTNVVVQYPVHSIQMNDKHETTELCTDNLLLYSEEVNERLHDNQTSGCHVSESPASEVADGHREQHRTEAKVSVMEKEDETKSLTVYSHTQVSCSAYNGTSESGVLKEDDVVKVRTRKVRVNVEKYVTVQDKNTNCGSVTVIVMLQLLIFCQNDQLLPEDKCLCSNLFVPFSGKCLGDTDFTLTCLQICK